ncbi:Zinc finger protein 800, partial [Stegodyphus mimosarum]
MVMPCSGSSKDSSQQNKNGENGHCAFEDLDHSVLQQPLNLGVTNVRQILKCIQSGSKEIKDIILNECNIVYECKVCTGLFRSLANFMYHKRCYCKKHLCEEMVLFENFEEETPVVIQPEPPSDYNAKTSQDNATTPEILDCTVDLVKTDLASTAALSSTDTASKPTSKSSDVSKEKTVPSGENKTKGKATEDKNVSQTDKNENTMMSRRTREKNAQAVYSTVDNKTAKATSSDEPPAKSVKITVKENSVKAKESDAPKPSPVSTRNSNVITSSNKNTELKETEIVKNKTVTEKNVQTFPKIIFKTIDGNSHAVFQSTEKKKLDNNNIKTKLESPIVQTKTDNDKLIIVLKKDLKVASCSDSKSSEKSTKESSKQSEFHFTRRKRLMTRNDCSVHELKCLVCKTQFMSLKTLYFHMLSLHSKKRLYYPCPFCKTLFVQMYGVTRHLISIHNKTKEQINKLRDVIKKKSVWRKVDDVNPSSDNSQSPLKTEDFQQKVEEKNEVKPNHNTFEVSCREGSPIKTIIKIGKNVTLHQCSKCNRVFGRKSSQVSHEKFCIMNAIKVETIDLTGNPTSPPPTVSFMSLSPKQNSPEQQISKPTLTVKQPSSDVKISARPKRGAEKQMHKDFVNSQTLKWRSANRVDTNGKAVSPIKKNNAKNLEKKVLSIMNAENLLCLKCDKKFSSYSNLRRHIAIHVGWTRFKCKYCEYQAYNKSQCWSHVQKAHAINESDMDKCIVNLVSSNFSNKKAASSNQISPTTKRGHEISSKSVSSKNNTIPKVKISKKKAMNGCTKNVFEKKIISTNKKETSDHKTYERKESCESKKENHESKKEISENKKEMPESKKEFQENKKEVNENKREIHENKKEKNQHPGHIHKYSISEYKKETSNYKSVTTSNPTTIILSKKIPTSAVQSILTFSPTSMSSTSNKNSTRSSPRKYDPKVPEDKSLVTRSSAYAKTNPIQIKLPPVPHFPEKTYAKKDRLISEWFPKKDLTNNARRDSAPLIIGLVPASSPGLNARAKNPGG